jgi:hypothetical protein
MACHAASVTTSLREVLKAGPLCLQRTLGPKKISAIALNSTRPDRRTSSILYLGAVVMPRCSSRARSLPVRTRASTPKDSTSSASQYIFSSSVSLEGVYSSLALSSISWSFGYCCTLAGESWAVGLSGTTSSISKGSSSGDASYGMSGCAPGVMACFEVPADQWTVGRCSSVQYDECEPSII